jgi:hypothetical protein
LPTQEDSSELRSERLGGSPHFHRPGELIAAVLREDQDELEKALGYVAADRIRTGHETVRDLLIAAAWMGANPVEMWPDSPCLCP